MVTKKTAGDYIFDSLNVVALTVLMLTTLYPFIYIAFSSVSRPLELANHTGLLIRPLGFSMEGYKAVLENPIIYSGYKNTLIYVIIGTTFNLIMTSMGAYVLSRKRFYWRKLITTLIIFTMFFSGGLIPTYLLVKGLHMTNTLWAMILPGLISTWNLFIMRTYFAGIPDSLEESAKMDGANDFYILYKIILPLSTPVIAVMIMYYGIQHWNAWFNAMIYLRKREMFPLQLVLREILITNSTDSMMSGVAGADEREMLGEVIKYSTIMVATLPILAVYPFLQKYFEKGVMIGAVKG